tara:strand:- start:3046 stop:3696 length:651 start_codon:yes stop_codon:yes gene_type:complete
MKEVLFNTPDQPCFIGAWYLPQISICDRIIAAYDSGLLQKGDGRLGAHKGNPKGQVKKTLKDSIDATLSERPDLIDDFTANLLAVLEQYKQKFPHANEVETFVVDELNIQKYPKKTGGYHAWHAERQGNNSRHLVWMTYLNDIEEGGETEFYYQKLKVKPRKGLTLIWPVDWTHTHKGHIAPNEEKMIITGWFSFLEQQPTVEEIDKMKKIQPVAA